MNRGLTLIELLVVLAVLAISLAVVIPNLRGSYETMKADSLTRDLVKDIRYFQYRSVMERRRYLMRYDSSGPSYHFLTESRKGNLTDWVPVEGRLGRPRKLPQNMSLWMRGKEKIFFLPNGRISEADIAVRSGQDTHARVQLGRSLLGAEVESKGRPGRAA